MIQMEIPLKAAGDSGGSKHPDVYWKLPRDQI